MSLSQTQDIPDTSRYYSCEQFAPSSAAASDPREGAATLWVFSAPALPRAMAPRSPLAQSQFLPRGTSARKVAPGKAGGSKLQPHFPLVIPFVLSFFQHSSPRCTPCQQVRTFPHDHLVMLLGTCQPWSPLQTPWTVLSQPCHQLHF